MITILLLVLIYLAFISLGLPDSLLGVAWDAIRSDMGLSLDAAGLVAVIATVGTVTSSLLSGYMIKKLGTGKIVFISCLMTGLALLGVSFIPSFIWLLLLAIPLGLGAGTVDAALNNYVATHYKAHHMNWLHSFWGVGATLGPIIMGRALASEMSWRGGYRIISLIQLSLAVLLFLSLPLWKKNESIQSKQVQEEKKDDNEKIIDTKVLKTKGVKSALVTFVVYCAIEISIGLWGSSYLIHAKGLPSDTAAYYIAIYYGSIMAGRFLSGFISFKLSNNNMIRIGILVAFSGAILMALPLQTNLLLVPFLLIGIGMAPIFPAMIHETPSRFGKDDSQTIIGFQMASAYIGALLVPPLLGVALKNISMYIFPVFLLVFMALMFWVTNSLRKINYN